MATAEDNIPAGKEDDDELLKELCLTNGVNISKLGNEGPNIQRIETFFSGYPRITGLQHFPNLTCLIIMGQMIEEITNLPELKSLEELWIAECQVKDIQGLGTLTKLKKLFLYGNKIQKIKNIEHLDCLEVLWLNGNRISRIEGLSNLKSVKELNLAENVIEKIGNSLNGFNELSSLNLSGNKLSSFKDITNLAQLPALTMLYLKDPQYAPNPCCLLCNYATHVLYHLPNLIRLDNLDVSSKTLRDLAETTVMKKKMFYNMKIKTLQRNTAELESIIESEHKEMLQTPQLRLRTLHSVIKDLEREISEIVENEPEKEDNASGDDDNDDVDENCDAEVKKYQLKIKLLKERIKVWAKKYNEVIFFFKESCERIRSWFYLCEQRLLAELDTGGNVRFEDGNLNDTWFSSCHDLVLSRFCVSDYRDHNVTGIKIHRITRVHNRMLRMKFEEKLARLSEDDQDIYCTTKNPSYKKLLEYLFWVWDPELAGGHMEPKRVLEEGFMDAESYQQLGKDGGVPMTNSMILAEVHRMAHMRKISRTKTCMDNCPFRQGQIIVAKVYVGKRQQVCDNKQINKVFYPGCDSVYRPKKHDKTCRAQGVPGTSSGNNCDCVNKQCEWFFFDNELVIPEYVVDFEYITRLKPRNPLFQMTEGLLSNSEYKISHKFPDAPDDADVLEEDPVPTQRPRLITLTDELILKITGANSLTSVTRLNLHGNGLTKLKQLQSLSSLKKLIVSFNELSRLDDLNHMHLEYLDASFNKIDSLEGFKGMNKLKYLDISWNDLHSTRDEISVLRKHAQGLVTLDLRENNWQKPDSLRLRVIGRLKTLKTLNGEDVTENESTAAFRMAAGSRISQVLLLSHSRLDTSRPRTLSLQPYAQVLAQTSHLKPDRLSEQDGIWYSKVTALHLDNQHISKLSNLDRLENLRWASFNNNDITKLEGLESCIHLEELSLENNCISKIEGLSRLGRLRRLSLGHNFITSLDVSCFEKLLSLYYLSIENNQITSLNGIQKLKSLMELYFGNNWLCNIREIFYLKQLPNFVILDLYGNPVTKESEHYRLFIIYHLKSVKALDGIAVELSEGGTAKDTFGGRLTQDFVAERLGHANFGEVRELNFPNCFIRSVDLGLAEHFRNLRSINLENNNMTSFSGLIHLINLRVLCLNHNHIESVVPKPKTNGKAKTVQSINQANDFLNPENFTPLLESLEVLHLGYNSIKDMAQLQLSRLTGLKAIFLQGNEITKIEGLEGLQDLRELVLDRNKIKNVSEASFLNQWNLQELHVEENRIKDLSNLSMLESLQRLYLGMNRIQDICELEKLEALPNLLEISVVNNAVARRLLHRPMLVFRMQNLLVIDGIPVSEEERTKAELYFMEQQIPQLNNMESTLPGLGQYKTSMPVKVTNVQLASPERAAAMFHEEDTGRRQVNGRENQRITSNTTRSGTVLYQPGSHSTSRSQYQLNQDSNMDRYNNRNNRR
ncbi:leucine-rich repeat-containing protein 9-like [Tubulanus polymorphus]|uniref:leucine-rich repeat-containing protein 9-like n=1 Tax=Tubulanus polymorphus TaxID=672921 RepID=UPI003DA4D342